MSDATQNNNAPSEVNIEWAYSGKAMRAQALLYLLVTLLAIGGGAYIFYAKSFGASTLPACYVLAVCLMFLWGYYYAVYFYRIWTIRYRLTDRHLYAYRGLLTRTSDSMELIQINDARLVQTLFDRIFNGGVGSIVLYCPVDKTDGELVIKGIDNPREIFEKLDSMRTALRAKRSILTGGV